MSWARPTTPCWAPARSARTWSSPTGPDRAPSWHAWAVSCDRGAIAEQVAGDAVPTPGVCVTALWRGGNRLALPGKPERRIGMRRLLAVGTLLTVSVLGTSH